jgi:hypoxanthine phosphoribosyltransferase
MDAKRARLGKVLVTKEKVAQIVCKTADWICAECAANAPDVLTGKEPVHLIIILKGAVVYGMAVMKELHQRGIQTRLEFYRTESYGHGTSGGEVRTLLDVQDTLAGTVSFVIEDIIDRGETLDYVMSILSRRKPQYLGVCALLNKPSRRCVALPPSYHIFTGMDIEGFVGGFGLDFDEMFRDEECVCLVEFVE